MITLKICPTSKGQSHFLSDQYAPRMAGTVNWGTATVIGVFAGMLYGGSKEAAASVVSVYLKCC